MNLKSILLVSALAVTTAANADILANWTFETSVPATAGPFAAEAGVNGASSFASGSHASGDTVYSNPVGNGSGESFSSNNWATGDYYQFTTSTTGYDTISISFDQMGSNTGPSDFSLLYSVDGSTFTNGGDYSVTNDSWSSVGSPKPQSAHSFDLSGISALADATTVYFRVAVRTNASINGSTIAPGGTGRIDNVLISGEVQAVPEPASMVALGLGAAALIRRRRSAK